MKVRLRLLTILSVILVNPLAHASQAHLDKFFENVDALSAKFVQSVVDESGMTLESSSGRFYLSRPGKFRWDYDSTDPGIDTGQQIIADGNSIYMYDPDLEQVTKRGLKDALGQVPSLLLVQTGENIDDFFIVTDFGLTDGLTWVGLKPRDQNAAYQQLLIGFAGDELNTINLIDGLGNETRLSLSAVNSNANIKPERFSFDPPEGVDILEE